MQISKTRYISILLAGVAAFPTMAYADDQNPQGGLSDIVVTARRKVENLQDVPVAVTAISAAQIQRYDMTSLEKISTQTPQFTIGRASNGSGAQLTLRGIGSSASSIGIEQSVAVILDGVYYGQGRVINEGFLDLQSVEMLKGPQALFFGKNATAGVISLKSAEPTKRAEFMARVGYEMAGREVVGEAVASGPLSDTLGIRVALRGSRMFGGYFDNAGLAKTYSTYDVATGVTTSHYAPPLTTDNPGARALLGRVTLQYKPTNRLTVTLRANSSMDDNDNNSWNYVPYACANPNGTFGINPAIRCSKSFTIYQNAFPADLAGTNPYSRRDGGLYNKYRSWAVTGQADYSLDHVNLTLVSNYNKNVNQWACDCTIVSAPDPLSAPSTEHSVFSAFSTEFRAQTRFDAPVNLMAGVLYQSTKRNHTQTGSFGGVSDSSAPAAMRYLGYFKRSETSGETITSYAQAEWKILSTLTAAAGARYTHETKDSYLKQPYVNAALQFLFPQNQAVTANQSWDNWSPEATLTWKPTRDLTLYGAYKTAYKSGGFSNSGFVSASTLPSDVAFNPETAAGFELGFKSTLLGRQLRLNLAVYSYLYKDLQVDFFNASTFAFITTNAGGARTRGIEFEYEYAPRAVEGLNLHGSVNYNRARYTNYIAPCYGGQTLATGCGVGGLSFHGADAQNLSGTPTAVAPEWAGSLGVSYEAAVSDKWRAGLSVDSRYSGHYLASAFGKPNSRQDAYLSVDASVRLKTSDNRYELALIGKNITNRFIVGGAIDAPNSAADTLGFVNMPRTVQLQGTVRF
ncbi:ligand-gated channel [Novosphingobium umbonatum]|uniref:Ligand-gated channel n=1 Tax=Novosphingobium umbonatum TaxID=1908524 RepID=A0A3S2USC2_9SPHN|nr:TonB-dependent receptor [Novosphingobium umbonatum]RVU05702.1 ligand-gated channel [Novosphingobium umbonatum]